MLLDSIEQRIFAISEGSVSKNFVHIKEELAEAYERIERIHEGSGGEGRICAESPADFLKWTIFSPASRSRT